jgi:hypothetical protein
MKEGIRQICDEAFYFCINIIKFTIPNSLELIGEASIYDCFITEFTIGNKVIKIGDSAFRYSDFTTIIIPLSVVEIGMDAFTDIENLTIFTEHTTKPNLWNYNWNFSGKSDGLYYPVYWAGQWHIEDGIPAPHTY